MESVIKQLVKIGHGMGAEVANDEPAVAKLLVELSSALDVQYERANALEAKCAALAAESAALREYRPQPSGAAMMEALDAFYEYHEDVPEQGMMAAFEILCCKRPETPITDSFLAEVRAQGVEAFANSLKVAGGHEHPYSEVANEFAAQLRKGVQS
ncbi:hypothetical protein M8O23_02305 [Enterobacter hormaechei]|nr:hypothetical protein [Enterobacter hormaechei]